MGLKPTFFILVVDVKSVQSAEVKLLGYNVDGWRCVGGTSDGLHVQPVCASVITEAFVRTSLQYLKVLFNTVNS